MTARRATTDDVPLLVTLMEEFYAGASFPLDRGWAERAFVQLLGDPERGAIWVAEADGEVAGYVVLSIAFSMEYGGLAGCVDDLYVRPAVRRRGVGRVALEARFGECRRRNVRAVPLEVGRDNAAAKALYARFGFTDNDRQLLVVRLG